MSWWKNFLCRFGIHRWDMPGGHCELCSACDEFFMSHCGWKVDSRALEIADAVSECIWGGERGWERGDYKVLIQTLRNRMREWRKYKKLEALDGK